MTPSLKDVAQLLKLFRLDVKELNIRVGEALNELIEKCNSDKARFREDTLTNLLDISELVRLFNERLAGEIRIMVSNTTVFQLRNSVSARQNLANAAKEILEQFLSIV